MKAITKFNTTKEFIDSLTKEEYDDLIKYIEQFNVTIEDCYEDSELVTNWTEYF